MSRRIASQINHFRVPVAVVVAASIALAVWAPASAAGPAAFKAPLLNRMAHTLPPSLAAHSPGPLSGLVRPHSIHRDTTPPSYSLFSSTLQIKTSTGLSRKEEVSANKTAGSATDEDLFVDHSGTTMCSGLPCQDGFTSWGFGNLPGGDLSVSLTSGVPNGHATMALGSASSGAFAGFSFTFTPTSGKISLTCNAGGSEYYWRGTLTGTQKFHTVINSTNANGITPLESSTLGDLWGPTGTGGTVSFPNTSSAITNFFTVDNNCQNTSGPPPPPGKTLCQQSTFFSSPFVHNSSFSLQLQLTGGTGTTYSYPTSSFKDVDASRDVSFSGLPSTGGFPNGTTNHPAGVNRTDFGLDNLPTIAWSLGASSPYPQTVTTTAPSTDTYFKGSATLKSSKSANQNIQTCYVQTGPSTYAAHTQYARYDTSGTATYSWTNSTTSGVGGLRFLADVGGIISVGNATASTSASIDHETYA